MNNVIVPVDDKLYSTLKIGTDTFPFQLFCDDLNHFLKGFVNWHKQKEIEISYILEGSVKVCLLKEEHILSAGDAFVIFPDRLHSIQPADDACGRYFTLIFSPCLLFGFRNSYFDKYYYNFVRTSAKGFYSIENANTLPSFYQNLLWIYENHDKSDAAHLLAIQRRLQDIWIFLSEHVYQTNSHMNTYIEETKLLQMIEYLRNNFTEKFSLTAMSDYLHISRGECCRFFKKMMGMTISDYLLDYRLGKATELLESTNLNITEIAHSVGFNSVSNFSSLFKAKTGDTPRGYRMQNGKANNYTP